MDDHVHRPRDRRQAHDHATSAPCGCWSCRVRRRRARARGRSSAGSPPSRPARDCPSRRRPSTVQPSPPRRASLEARCRRLSRGQPPRLQDRFDTRRLADRIDERLVRRRHRRRRPRVHRAHGHVLPGHRRRARAVRTARYKGGDPGFVRVLDEHTIAFPNYDGNGMYLSMGNVLVNPRGRHAVHRLRAAPADAPERRRRDRRARPAAGRVPRGAVRRAGAGDPRSSPTARATSTSMQLVERSRFVPRAELRDAGARLEAARLVARRAAGRTIPAADPSREPLES